MRDFLHVWVFVAIVVASHQLAQARRIVKQFWSRFGHIYFSRPQHPPRLRDQRLPAQGRPQPPPTHRNCPGEAAWVAAAINPTELGPPPKPSEDIDTGSTIDDPPAGHPQSLTRLLRTPTTAYLPEFQPSRFVKQLMEVVGHRPSADFARALPRAIPVPVIVFFKNWVLPGHGA